MKRRVIVHTDWALETGGARSAPRNPGNCLIALSNLALPPVEFLDVVKVDAIVDHDGCNFL